MVTLAEIKQCASLIAQIYPITKIELFGSYANGTSKETSDIDLLVEFSIPCVSLLMLNTIKYQLEELLHTSVDVIHGPLPQDTILEVGRRIAIYGA